MGAKKMDAKWEAVKAKLLAKAEVTIDKLLNASVKK